MPKNAFEDLLKLVHSLTDEEPKPNLHIGEAMSCWTYLAMLADRTVGIDLWVFCIGYCYFRPTSPSL